MTENHFYRALSGVRTPLDLSDDDLDLCAKRLAKPSPFTASTVPAGFTYLLQFIDHDLANDQSGIVFDSRPALLSPLINGRSPFFDLDSLYGRNLKRSDATPVVRSDLMDGPAKLRVGETAEGSVSGGYRNDLPRDASGKAIVVDPRNNENLAVAQMHVAFLRFHNALVDRFGNTGSGFEKTREVVIKHYQWVVVEELLPLFVRQDVLAEARRGSGVFYPRDLADGTIPLEFSIGAFRFGHSMIRNAYQWNRVFSGDVFSQMARVDDLFENTGNGVLGRARRQITSDWVVDWRLFFDIGDSAQRFRNRFNFAARIDASISSSLGDIGGAHIPEYVRRTSLAALDLFRSRAVGMPSGQAVAEELSRSSVSGIPTTLFAAEEIADRFGLPAGFRKGTPLWLYILYEAEREQNGLRLGATGSRIVAETIVRLLELSPYSILETDFSADKDFLGSDGKFSMADLITLAGVANPIGQP